MEEVIQFLLENRSGYLATVDAEGRPHARVIGLNYVEDCVDAEQYKTVLRLIFEAMHQEQHYNMMMGIDA